jgi:hypothetical protein
MEGGKKSIEENQKSVEGKQKSIEEKQKSIEEKPRTPKDTFERAPHICYLPVPHKNVQFVSFTLILMYNIHTPKNMRT